MDPLDLAIKELKKKEEQFQLAGKKRLAKKMHYTASIFISLKEKDIEADDMNSRLKQLKTLLNTPNLRPYDLTRFNGSLMQHLKTQYGLISKGYYQNQWMAIGMTALGLPFGIILGITLDNFAFMSIGIPIGIPIGMAIGMEKDKKAKAEGLQLDIPHDF